MLKFLRNRIKKDRTNAMISETQKQKLRNERAVLTA